MKNESESPLSNIEVGTLEEILTKVGKGKNAKKLFGDIEQEFEEMKAEVSACKKSEDIPEKSVYIESELGDILFNILKVYSEKLSGDINIESIISSVPELSDTEVNSNLFQQFTEKVTTLKSSEEYSLEDLNSVLGLVREIIKELATKGYIQVSLETIIENTQEKFSRRYRKIKRGSLNTQEEEDNDIWWEGCKAFESKEKKQEAAKRKVEFEGRSIMNRTLNGLGSDNIEVNYLETLSNLDDKTTVLVLQKFAKEEVVDICRRGGINLEFTRKGFASIKLESGEKIVFIMAKDIDSTEGFSDIEKYVKNVFYLGGNDMVRKYQARNGGESLIDLASIDSKLFFGTQTELLVLADKKSVDKMNNGKNPDIVATKFRAILSEKAIAELERIKEVYSIDSNSEALLQVLRLKYQDDVVTGVEIVQSGASVKDTGNYILREGEGEIVVYKPSTRSPGEDFSTDDIYKVIQSPNEQLSNFVKTIQTEIDVKLCQVNKKIEEEVKKVLTDIDKGSIKDFLIILMKLRGRELKKFKRIKFT